MEFTLTRSTVYILVGPTMCGKSTFISNLLDEADLDDNAVISSDAIRRQLLGFDAHRHSGEMMSVSANAFKLLFTELEHRISYPVRQKYVFIDTTAMQTQFRDEVREMARKQGYRVELIVFDYKSNSDYFKYVDPEEKSTEIIVRRAVKRFKQEVMPALNRNKYDKVTLIRQRDVRMTYRFEDKFDTFKPIGNEVYGKAVVIGDVHGCFDEFQALMQQVAEKHPDAFPVLIGDYLDKGPKVREMIEWLCEHEVLCVAGNHEAYIYRRLVTGEGEAAPKEIEDTYFDSIHLLRENPDLLEKFKNLYENHTAPFARLVGSGNLDSGGSIYLSHSPCTPDVLGSYNPRTFARQRNLRLEVRGQEEVAKQLQSITGQFEGCHPLQLVGHISVQDVAKMNRTLFIDTGCVHGNKLTGVVIENGKIIEQLSVPAQKCYLEPTDGLYNLNIKKEVRLEDFDFDNSEMRNFNAIVRNPEVKYVSGTMPPAPSFDGDLESLKGAFWWFERQGFTKVCLQPKYMGSRAQVYLDKDRSKCFATSRNGYKISEDWCPEIAPLLDKYHAEFSTWNDKDADGEYITSIVIDAELTPWSVLGKNLIEKHFIPYGNCVQYEIESLGSDEEFLGFNTERCGDPDFVKFVSRDGEKDMSALVGIIRRAPLGENYHFEQRRKHFKSYQEQLEIYAKDVTQEEPGLQPFAALHVNGKHVFKSPSMSFDYVKAFRENDHSCLVVDLTKPEEVEAAEAYLATLVQDQHMEGVVVKPEQKETGEYNPLPYMKVRNHNYLRLVYGYDYLMPSRYDGLVEQKNISGKVRVAIEEAKLGEQLLLAEGEDRKLIVAKMMLQLREEKTLDPRL